MSTASINVVGNVTRDPELRFSASGVAYAKFGIAVNRRVKGDDGAWKDGPTSFFDCTVFKQLAENTAESVHKGDRVIVAGTVEIRTFDRDDGTKGQAVGITADEVGLSLAWATAKATKTQRSSDQQQAPTPAAEPEESYF